MGRLVNEVGAIKGVVDGGGTPSSLSRLGGQCTLGMLVAHMMHGCFCNSKMWSSRKLLANTVTYTCSTSLRGQK